MNGEGKRDREMRGKAAGKRMQKRDRERKGKER